MKVVNLMCFVRQIDERLKNSTEQLFDFTKQQVALVNEYPVDKTFLLQYDTVSDEQFVRLFKEETDERTELGLWYEIVEPLTTACGLPYRSENGWKWDWHIIPGFSMAYTPHERELLIDEAMRKFKEVFGFYPKTVASWLIDTHTVNYLTEHYDISAMAICRDQANTDAYTLRGGYFNGGYYPSKSNMFTPAQTAEYQGKTPIFRLLGPCPIYNYDEKKYVSDEIKAIKHVCFTLEPGCFVGSTPKITDWFWHAYYDNESLGFSYAQIGQENSFMIFGEQVLRGMRMQIEQLLDRGDVTFQKMKDTGDAFRGLYSETPATAVSAMDTWDTEDLQSVWYDCKHYSANLFRAGERIFFRSFFLFDERVKDHYLEKTCETFDAVYENLPLIDTIFCEGEEGGAYGLSLDTEGDSFVTEREGENALRIRFGEDSVLFREDRIEIRAKGLYLYRKAVPTALSVEAHTLSFRYKDACYRVEIEKGTATLLDNGDIKISSADDQILLRPARA
ncbi:MAG: hypothetical protein IKA76_05510 [Clostridia bacterium]|nr:hypothetical protein [Clostridia bacterium]